MYNIAIALYAFIVRLVSPFNKKAKKMLAGQKKTFNLLEKKINKTDSYIWFHASSLGEFEQGRPLMEMIKKEKREYKILLTFFSPSGYEVQKNYTYADLVCYLPFDFPRNAAKFLNFVNPAIAIFIKYEFWMNYLSQLKKREIPAYIISAIFRSNQIFFRRYGKSYRKVLHNFKWFFLQDDNSKELLKTLNINDNITISGDTRFDRVDEICQQHKNLPVVDTFLNNNDANKVVLVAGSTWTKDEDIIISYFNQTPEIKLIIAPHVISDEHIGEITSKMKRPFVLYSKSCEKDIQEADCLIIDCFGLLSFIYRYGKIAYVGGGFGAGIHNILEAAVYSVPVIFGPNYQKFKEAKELIASCGAVSISNEDEFTCRMNEYLSYSSLLKESGENANRYVKQNLGATRKIYDKIF
ncbi:MAG: 3-deoxy-D-manno-octulosonic acid transferase [Dysgonamonadaceae bacterium]|jgi:3-deoxy-D-manno-octulosonic-acid transferase|nr:3-deoxy-D-manno-octulosonic acid transferase [Dysgonamonadaceae bacterium]